MINIAVVEENWFNLMEALDDGEYEETCPDCGEQRCICSVIVDQNLEIKVIQEVENAS